MTDKVRQQIMFIRDSGLTNLLDLTHVQRLAFEWGLHELVIFIEENRGEYIRFIFYGDAG